MKTAEAIIALREKMKITQAELARRLGVTVTTVSRYENGHDPSRQIIKRLADVAESDAADAIPLRDIFEQKRREGIAARIESLPSGGTQRRVPLDDLASWAAKADEIKEWGERVRRLAKTSKSRLRAAGVSPSDLMGLDDIYQQVNTVCGFAETLAEDIEIYIAPPDEPGVISYTRLEKIKNAKDQARKTPKEE